MTKTRRDFTLEFKREAVALLQLSGRPLTRIAAELGIQPSMLRNWRALQNGGAPRSRATGAGSVSAAAAPPGPSPADPVGPALGPTKLPRSRARAVSWSARAWSATF